MGRFTVLVLLLNTFLPIPLAAQAPDDLHESPVAHHQIPRIEERIEVDGVLDEIVWGRAWSATLDYEVRPGKTPRPLSGRKSC